MVLLVSALLLGVYGVSAVVCGVLVYYVIWREFDGDGRTPFDVYLCPGLAGFSVFPIINTALAVVAGGWTLVWLWRESRR